MSITRRELLVGAAAVVVARCGPGRPIGICEIAGAKTARSADAFSAITEDDATFPLGVQAGAMRDTTATLWGYASDTGDKILRVWTESDELVSETQVTLGAGYVKVHLEELTPNTRYRYAWFDLAAEKRSAIGRFRTAYPDGCAAPLSVVATTCTHLKNAPFRSLEISARYDADVLCHLGDMTYQYGTSEESYRSTWQQTLRDPGYRALLSKLGSYITWDDHELTDSREYYAQPPERVAISQQAFFQHTPMTPGENGRLWTSFRWGDTAEFFVLDCRSERKPETRTSKDAIYLSRAQMDWLKDGLARSRAHFKIILNSVPMIAWPEVWVVEDDRWQGYEAQREELLSHIDERAVRNVWFLSGDFHVGCVGRLEAKGKRARMFEILVGPGANGPNPIQALPSLLGTDIEEVFPAAQFLHYNWDFAATILDFNPQTDSVRVRFIDTNTEAVIYDAELSQR